MKTFKVGKRIIVKGKSCKIAKVYKDIVVIRDRRGDEYEFLKSEL